MKTWDALRYLKRQDNLPWLCAGDFNEILFQTEQRGGNPRSFNQMEGFRECLGDCGLEDLGFTGYPFTWDNKQDQEGNIQVRLDRATCNDEFLQFFPETAVEHVLTEESNHVALVIRAAASLDAVRTKKQGGSDSKRLGQGMTIMRI